MTRLKDGGDKTFGEHIEVLRKVLTRIIIVSFAFAIIMFLFKDSLFTVLLAPCSSDFSTFRVMNRMLAFFGMDKQLYSNQIDLITTELPSQFMAHMTVALYMGALMASPYIIFELFRFISPALYENERKYSVRLGVTMYVLFILGLLVSYFVLFPVSCRFLASYQVSERVVAMISLDSYISTFVTLTLLMGLVFQLPVISFLIARFGVIDCHAMRKYRKHVFVIIMIVAAVITPPDAMTLILVSAPLYLLYELSILVVKTTTAVK